MTKKDKLSKLIGVFPFKFDDSVDGSAIPDVIQLIPVGQWDHDLYGKIIITASDIREYEQNFNAKIRKGVYITAGHEGFEELPASGWVMSVESRADGLWGKVEWTGLGKGQLADKQFKYFSPELSRDYEDPQTHELHRNVITGGALTKSPYFKELQTIVFSDKDINKTINEEKNMLKLEEIVAKKVEDLNDEEIAFLKEHQSELTEDQKNAFTAVIDEPETDEEKTAREAKEKEAANIAAGLNADGSAKEDGDAAAALSDKNVKKVSISMSELALLRQKADQGQQAFAELRKQKLDSAVTALVFSTNNQNGKFMPKSTAGLRAFMESLNADQTAKFSALLKELPDNVTSFKEIGSNNGSEGTAMAEVEIKVNLKMSEKKMKYSDALREVMSENKGLEERYDGELVSARR